MGTNYYLKYNCCDKCNRCDEIHIGKKSAGWSFSFHGIKKDGDWNEGDIKEIKSWQDWKGFISKKGAIIRDEYGETILAGDFIAMIEGYGKEGLNHTIEMRKDPEYKHSSYLSGLWLDEEGYSFSEGEFS